MATGGTENHKKVLVWYAGGTIGMIANKKGGLWNKLLHFYSKFNNFRLAWKIQNNNEVNIM